METINNTENKGHILVVDDDQINIMVAERILETHSYKVSTAYSGEETLEFLKETTPDLILMDLHMPGMDGFEIVRRIKENEKASKIPIIFLTADNDRQTEVQCFKEGAADFITKPFEVDIMIQRIGRIVELHKLQYNLQNEVDKQLKKSEEKQKQFERLSMQIVKALASAVDAKDRYTNGHSTRVADYSRRIAQLCGKDKSYCDDIYYMAILHDVGKIGVPDEIINKTARLDDEEYAKIKTHPVIGAEILKNISEMPEIITGARWHHERYDGRGYPDGLKGEEIPEKARIIGVADAYDAMTSTRSYRNVMSQADVRSEIVKGKGTQFDPQFADIMIQMIDADTEYKMKDN